ncbi:MAG: hypothetical protein F4X97_15575 [Boseongicola sp. SB0662_bin_57]|nr:hypothetical protein [Boseongicola sp. SB0662_bin_57]
MHSSRPVSFAGADRLIVPWVAQRIGMAPEDFRECTAMGVRMGDELLCGVVFNEFRPARFGSSMQATIVQERPGWATRTTLRDMFRYPFEQMGVVRLWVSTSRRNRRARRLAERLGFRLEGVARRAWDGQTDAHILSMFPEECRWTDRGRGQENGKEVRAEAA